MTVLRSWPAGVVEFLSARARQETVGLEGYPLQAASGRDRIANLFRQTMRQDVRHVKMQAKPSVNCAAGNNLGGGLTVRDRIEEGRRF